MCKEGVEKVEDICYSEEACIEGGGLGEESGRSFS